MMFYLYWQYRNKIFDIVKLKHKISEPAVSTVRPVSPHRGVRALPPGLVPVHLVARTGQRLHQVEGRPVPLVQVELHLLVVRLSSIGEAPLDGGVGCEHQNILVVPLHGLPGLPLAVVLAVLTVPVTVDRNSITEQSAHLPGQTPGGRNIFVLIRI